MRPKLNDSYVEMMSQFLALATGDPQNKVTEFVRNVCKERYKDRTVTNLMSSKNGDTELKTTSLMQYINARRNDVVTPSGSCYKSTDTKEAFIGKMVVDKLGERKANKQLMFKAIQSGDKVRANLYNLIQTSIKINLNSLPGGFGSAYNLFYDKGGYNAITSLVRSIIANGYTATERCLGGNFGWYDESMALNHINLCKRFYPGDEQLGKVMNKFRLRYPSRDELQTFMHGIIVRYTKEQCPILDQVISRLTELETAYIYYLGNLKHIIRGNETVFVGWMEQLFDFSECPTDDPKKIYDLDGDLVTMLSLILGSKEGLEKSPYDLPSCDPDLGARFVGKALTTQGRFDVISELFETLVFLPFSIPSINRMKPMLRNTVIISDTDSVIFTVNDWVEWWLKASQKSPVAEDIVGLVIFWLTKIVERTVHQFGRERGACDKHVKRLGMKNEFLYPVLIMYEIKKHYAGLITIQEGVVMPKPKTDIKGIALRGSSMCRESIEFIEKLIVDGILKPAVTGKLSARKLIEQTLGFEKQIIDSLKAGDPTYLKITSVRLEKDYSDADRTAFYYYSAWNTIFGEKYGEIRLPTKSALIPILKPDQAFWDDLTSKSPKIANAWKEFESRGKPITTFALAPTYPRIPEELIPLVNWRKVLEHNTSAVYLTINQLGIPTYFTKQMLFLSDLYV